MGSNFSIRERLGKKERPVRLKTIGPDLNYGYAYPTPTLNLRPGAELHDLLVLELLEQTRHGRDALNRRLPVWNALEQTQAAYIPTSTAEKLAKRKDSRTPVSIVVPFTYAMAESLCTQVFASYATNECLHLLEGQGPEDHIGAALLELNLAAQSRRFRELTAINTSIKDELTYGFSVLSPRWETRRGFKRRSVPMTYTDPLTGEDRVLPGTLKGQRQAVTAFEGNRVLNVHPRNYFQDPNVPTHCPQDAEYLGWLRRENRMTLLAWEQEPVNEGRFFNAKYLSHLSSMRSTFFEEEGFFSSSEVGSSDTDNTVDVVYIYRTLVPDEWGLGPSRMPEKWMFAVAADSVLICAQPLDLDHDMYPVAISATESDGYAVGPMSKLEPTFGMQQGVDFLWNMHVASVKKGVFNQFIGDPSRVNMRSWANPGAGGLIEVNRLALGMKVDDVVKQLQVSDVTRNNIADIFSLHDWMQRSTGATDTLMGVMRVSGERRSATESRGARLSSLSRIDHLVKVKSDMQMYDLGLMMASQTIQFMSEDTWLKLNGRWEQELRAEFAPNLYAAITRDKIDVNYDIVVGDSARNGEEFIDQWINLYNMVAANPMLSQQVDLLRVFKHIARLGGARTVSEFLVKNPIGATALPDQAVADAVAAGDLTPVGGGGGGAGVQVPLPAVGWNSGVGSMFGG